MKFHKVPKSKSPLFKLKKKKKKKEWSNTKGVDKRISSWIMENLIN